MVPELTRDLKNHSSFVDTQQATRLDLDHDLRKPLEVLKIDAKEWYPSLLGFSFDWYIDRLSEAIDYLFTQHGKLILVGHSAAGWIARLCLGEEPYMGVRLN